LVSVSWRSRGGFRRNLLGSDESSLGSVIRLLVSLTIGAPPEGAGRNLAAIERHDNLAAPVQPVSYALLPVLDHELFDTLIPLALIQEDLVCRCPHVSVEVRLSYVRRERYPDGFPQSIQVDELPGAPIQGEAVGVLLEQIGHLKAQGVDPDALDLDEGILAVEPIGVSYQAQRRSVQRHLMVLQEDPARSAAVAVPRCGIGPGVLAADAVERAPESTEIPYTALPLVVDLVALVPDHLHLPVGQCSFLVGEVARHPVVAGSWAPVVMRDFGGVQSVVPLLLLDAHATPQ